AKLNKTEINKNESVELTIPVKNIGKRDGTEIVQVYIRKVNDTDGPIKTLRGFQRVIVPSGKTVQAIIHLPYTSFEFFDRTKGEMIVTPGEYEVLYGNSSDIKDLNIIKITVVR
ncbi:MAG TPA: glycosyl hydrolase, partial [Bacteroidales bacterium]|nr:glycosyl hydrolase [Bacteroidales bacterium]